MRPFIISVTALLLVAACDSTTPEKAPAAKPAGDQPAADKPAPFPVNKWVRTQLFGGGKEVLGYTYVDRSKGNSLKGEVLDGLTIEAAADKIKKAPGHFPSMTMQPIPAGHKVTPLTPDEVKQLGLPEPPDWLASYK
jgi:hypothetical protein